jgi:hypothetical protein
VAAATVSTETVPTAEAAPAQMQFVVEAVEEGTSDESKELPPVVKLKLRPERISRVEPVVYQEPASKPMRISLNPEPEPKPIELPPEEEPIEQLAKPRESQPAERLRVEPPTMATVTEVVTEVASEPSPKATIATPVLEPAPLPAAPKPAMGYANDYTWLRGTLEFSAIDRRWKLRYIPIDGATDRFGGSVILGESADLDGFRPGELVEVRGRVGRRTSSASDFAPPYEVRLIARQ